MDSQSFNSGDASSFQQRSINVDRQTHGASNEKDSDSRSHTCIDDVSSNVLEGKDIDRIRAAHFAASETYAALDTKHMYSEKTAQSN